MEREKHELKQTRDTVRSISKILLVLLLVQLLILGIVYPDWSGVGVITFIFTALQKLFMIFLGDMVAGLNEWYDGFFLAPVLVFLLKCIIPVALLAALGLWYALEAKIKDQTTPGAAVGVPVKMDQDPGGAAAAARYELLLRRGQETPLLKGDMGVRVQVLDPTIDGRKDYIAIWNREGKITIPVSEGVGIVLWNILNEQTQTCCAYIEGACDESENGTEEFKISLFPLKAKSPLVITRNGEAACLAITWLGGGDHR